MASEAVADPGFPVWGVLSLWWGGGTDIRHGHYLVKMYAKTKEFDPVGGRMPVAPLGSTNVRLWVKGSCDGMVVSRKSDVNCCSFF